MQQSLIPSKRVLIPLDTLLSVLFILAWSAFLAYWALREPHAADTAVERLPTKELADWLTAIGTCGAVIVALWQVRGARNESASQRYFERAESMLRIVVNDFILKTDTEGRPRNDRRHWLNFARGIEAARSLATGIKTSELKIIWTETEHYWRERVYDVLQPQWDSYPAEYYGYTKPAEMIKNFAQGKDERQPLSEPSLVLVYRWVAWPKGRPDSLDRKSKFTDDEIELMRAFGPRGLGEYISILRDPKAHGMPPATGGASAGSPIEDV